MINPRIIKEADEEYRKLVRKGVRSPEIMGELLEREKYADISKLRNLGTGEKEMVEKYIRAFVFLGYPQTAARISAKSGLNLDWKNEKDVVTYGYRSIANRSTLHLGKEVELDRGWSARIREMKDYTGIDAPDDVMNHFANVIATLPPNKTSLAFRSYVTAGLKIDEQTMDRFYDTVGQSNSSSDVLARSISLYKSSGIRPQKSREKLLGAMGRAFSLDKIESSLQIFMDVKKAEDTRDFLGNKDIPQQVKIVTKLASGTRISPEEKEQLYRFVFEHPIIILSPVSSMQYYDHFRSNIDFLRNHGLSPPENVEKLFPERMDERDREYATALLKSKQK